VAERGYQGYLRRELPAEDAELTHVGPGTPCGEYLRRYWQPVIMTERLRDLPVALRVLGEDLVIFRDLSGDIGLLNRHCSHRGASLEYGIVMDHGISCCYHGWHYACDGTLIATPSEPATSRVRQRVVHGAYPTHEYRGIVFAYMGPPGTAPEFPRYDVYGEDAESVPFLLTIPCNWLQVYENTQDPIHVLFLHARSSGVQFAQSNLVRQVIEYRNTPLGMMNIQVRRMGARAWVRTVECMLPNGNQTGAIWEEAEEEKAFQRAGLTRWVVPIDNTNSMIAGWRWFSAALDPRGQGDRASVGDGKIDFMGQGEPRPYEETQRAPGDYEAQVSQRPIAIHALEHLGASDQGVAMLRQLIRQAIRALARDGTVAHPAIASDGMVATVTQDSVLPLPPDPDADEARLQSFGRAVADAVLDPAFAGRAARAARIRTVARDFAARP